MFSAPRSDAQTRPTREPAGSAGDLVDELHVARPDEHRDDRQRAHGRGPGPRRRGTSSSRRGRSGTGRAARAGRRAASPSTSICPSKAPVEPLCVVARVGVRALGEEDLDERARVASARVAAAKAAEATSSAVKPASAPRRIISATMPARASAPRFCGGRSATWVPGAVATRDVAGVGQTTIDRADRVGVHSEGGTQLPHRGAAGSRAAADRSRSGRRAASRSGSRSGRRNRARRRARRAVSAAGSTARSTFVY